MNRIKKIKSELYRFSLRKNLYINFKYLPFRQAIKFPIWVSRKTLLLETSGNIKIEGRVTCRMIKFGYGKVGIFDLNRSRGVLEVIGQIIFRGKAHFGHGCKVSVGKFGKLIIGDNLHITAESSVVCHKHIEFGNNCLISWDNLVMDTDLHKIKNEEGKILNEDIGVKFGNNIWMGCRCLVLKGSNIASGTIIAANSLLSGKNSKENCVIGGNPTRVIKENVFWNY